MKGIPNKDNFPNIIGYEDVKKSLNRILDVIRNPEKYAKLGVRIPHGLILVGEPGIGKSSLAKEFIKATNRKSYVIRKARSNGSFISNLNYIFNKAKCNTPSIIFLDDIDRFSDTNHENTNSDEYIAIQSLIDSVADYDVFIIATANDIDCLPNSLLRAGRFDNKFSLKVPTGKEAEQIIEYYLKNKNVAQDICANDIAQILSNQSCAVLEKVVNEAGIIAGYQNHTAITQEDMIKASLSIKYDIPIDNKVNSSKYLLETAYHEAGHALVAELLEPSSISYISAIEYSDDLKGLTVYKENEHYLKDFKYQENRLKALLAGKATTELVFGKVDVGANSDMNRAYTLCNKMIDDYTMYGFDTHVYECRYSESIRANIEDKIKTIISVYYREVMSILRTNRDLLDKIAHELAKRGILFSRDINEIKANYLKGVNYERTNN